MQPSRLPSPDSVTKSGLSPEQREEIAVALKSGELTSEGLSVLETPRNSIGFDSHTTESEIYYAEDNSICDLVCIVWCPESSAGVAILKEVRANGYADGHVDQIAEWIWLTLPR